ncbi:hypothetical protein, partial [Klebsiella pneumoniae]|uniref:hypothetical protein n=1 Tax=Klebsiella pneumoniae TaxID=573 RepID=UPI00265740F7
GLTMKCGLACCGSAGREPGARGLFTGGFSGGFSFLTGCFFLAIVNQSTFLIQKNINFPAFYALESFRFVIHRQAFVHVCN